VEEHFQQALRSTSFRIEKALSGQSPSRDLWTRSRDINSDKFASRRLVRRAIRLWRPLELEYGLATFVGVYIGFLDLPDKSQRSGINTLAAKCRVCRVFIGVESPGEIENFDPPRNQNRSSHRLPGIDQELGRNGVAMSGSLNKLPKFPARLEVGNLLCRNFDSYSSFWIARHAALSLARAEASEPADFNLLAPAQRQDSPKKQGGARRGQVTESLVSDAKEVLRAIRTAGSREAV
jgi:hypothetical protein